MMTELNLSIEERLQRLTMHQHDWLRARYDAEINAKVAKAIDDTQLLKQAIEQLTRVVKALDVLQAETATLQAEYEEEYDVKGE